MKILVTGSAGFIGFHLVERLLNLGFQIVGIDNLNDYYDVNLKLDRLNVSGVKITGDSWNNKITSTTNPNYIFIKMNLEDQESLNELFVSERFDLVCNLAAQAGVRYSITNPYSYLNSNILGFLNILEACRNNGVKNLLYASSSSVYGNNSQMPFSVEHKTESPISFYAVSKKSNELMAHTYSHLYGIRTTGLRFFTVYGPWGRPDMAYFSFAKEIVNEGKIKVFNHGNMMRDFTYIDDIIDGIVEVLNNHLERVEFTAKIKLKNVDDLYDVVNLGNNKPEKLLDFIGCLEKHLGKIVAKEYLPIEGGDVEATWADIDSSNERYNYQPKIAMDVGLKNFSDWFRAYYELI